MAFVRALYLGGKMVISTPAAKMAELTPELTLLDDRHAPVTVNTVPDITIINDSIAVDRISLKLHLVDKLYQKSIYPAVQRVAAGERLAAPLVVDLDPTTACDLACPECISAPLLNQGGLARGRIARLAEEFVEAGVRAVILIGGGEPLMHPSVGSVIDTLHEGGVHIGLVTNGTLIGRYLDQLAEKLSWVRVSVDAATAETYGRFRPSKGKHNAFSRVIDNMRELAARGRCDLGYSFLLMQRRNAAGEVIESNYHEVAAAGRLARDLGCDYFEVKAAFDDDHFIVRQDAADIESVDNQIADLRELETDEFHVLYSSTWTALHAKASAVQEKQYERCAVTELRTTVTPSGVYTCPYHRGKEAARIGDVTTTSFGAMWRAADTSIVDPRRDCRFHCARHASNLEVASIAAGNSRRLVDDVDLFI